MAAALPLDGDEGGVGPGVGGRQEGDGDTVTPPSRVHSSLSVDQEVLGGLLELSLGVELRESVVSVALPSLGGGPQVGDDGDGLLHVGDQRGRGDVRYDMFWTEVAARGTDGADVKILIQGDGDAQRGEERHLPQIIRGQHRAGTVGPGL